MLRSFSKFSPLILEMYGDQWGEFAGGYQHFNHGWMNKNSAYFFSWGTGVSHFTRRSRNSLKNEWKTVEIFKRACRNLNVIHDSRKLDGVWVQVFGAMISGIVWVDRRYLWLVNGCLEYHQPIITNACPSKWSQKSWRQKLVPILPRVSDVGNCITQ